MTIWWSLLALLSPGHPAAPPPSATAPAPAALERYVRAQLADQHIPGAAVAIVRDDQPAQFLSFGSANLDWQIPVTPDTRFESGSVGKQFTAAGIMRLAELGKVNLDAPLRTYFPDAPDTWKPITVRHLLNHTSGIPTFPYGGALDLRQDYTEDELVKIAAALPLSFPPGTKWKYSNTGYALLGILIHRVTGQFYGDFLHKEIFAPLGMTSSGSIQVESVTPRRASGYTWDGDTWHNQEWVSPSLSHTGDSGLLLTARDLTRWAGELAHPRVLRPGTWQQMWTPARLSDGTAYPYGFGWALGGINGHRLIEHAGQWQGFTTAVCRFPDDKLTVVVLTNLGGAEPVLIARGIAGLVVPALHLNLPPRKPLSDRDPEVIALLRQVLLASAKGESNADRFTDELQAVVKPHTDETSKGLKALGDLGEITVLKRLREGEYLRFDCRARFANGTLHVALTLTPDGKIAGIVSTPE